MQESIDTHRGMIRLNEGKINEIKKDLVNKADAVEVGTMKRELKDCTRYEDFKELYSKVIPAIHSFETKLIEQSKELEQCKEMISRLDEVMAHKASKLILDDVLFRMRGLVTLPML
jgi:hypothetical protein